MPVQLPDRNTIFIANLQEVRDRMPEANTGVGEPYWVISQIIATAVWSVFQPVAFVADQIFPTSANIEFLVRHGNARRIYRKGAGQAKGTILVSGPVGSVQNGQTAGTDESSNTYTLDSSVTLTNPAWTTTTILSVDPNYRDRFIALSTTGMQEGNCFTLAGEEYCIRKLPGGTSVMIYGYLSLDPTGMTITATASARVPITADLTGAAGNLSFRSIMTLGTPGTNINPTSQVLEMGGGADLETESSWAYRIEEVMSEYPAGGNRAQLVGWGKGMSTKQEREDGLQKDYALGVDRVFCYPLFRGRG